MTDIALSSGAVGQSVAIPVQTIGISAIVCDPDGMVLMANTQAISILGPSVIPGKWLHELMVDTNTYEMRRMWHDRFAQGSGWSHECQVMRLNGSVLDLFLVAIPVNMASLSKQAWLVIIQDLTEANLHARQMEIYAQELSQLYQANKRHLQQLEEAQQSRDHFFSLASHELKTPLTSLKAALEMLTTPEFFPSRAEDVIRLRSNVKRSLLRLERVVNDVLDLAIEQNIGLSVNFGQVDIVEVIQSVADEMSPLLKEKGLCLEWPAKHKKSLIIRGDEIRLQQVVQNLLSNAIKAAPSNGTIHIAVRRKLHYVCVIITNPGVIIDPAIVNSMFEPFVKSTAGSYRAGAGLGLTVVNALVKAHGGSVTVATRQQEVAISFTIPLDGYGTNANGGNHENTRDRRRP